MKSSWQACGTLLYTRKKSKSIRFICIWHYNTCTTRGVSVDPYVVLRNNLLTASFIFIEENITSTLLIRSNHSMQRINSPYRYDLRHCVPHAIFNVQRRNDFVFRVTAKRGSSAYSGYTLYSSPKTFEIDIHIKYHAYKYRIWHVGVRRKGRKKWCNIGYGYSTTHIFCFLLLCV